ncbi:MAG: superinfection immunity protein [Gemmataceae bacterium]
MSLIRFRCPGCGQALIIGAGKARTVIRCLKCKAQVRVPEDPVLEGIPLHDDGSSAAPSPPQVRTTKATPVTVPFDPGVEDSPTGGFDDDPAPAYQNQQMMMGLMAAGIVGFLVVVLGGILFLASGDSSEPRTPLPARNQQADNPSSTGSRALFPCVTLFVLGMYAVPTLVAFLRDHHNKLAILAVNLFFGWSGVGWVLALVWALTEPRPREQIHLHYSPGEKR